MIQREPAVTTGTLDADTASHEDALDIAVVTDHGVTSPPPRVPRAVRVVVVLVIVGVIGGVVINRVQAAREADLFVACQDNYNRFMDLGEEARTALAANERERAEDRLRAIISEARRFPVCYEDDEAQELLRRVESGLRSGDLYAPPEPVGIA